MATTQTTTETKRGRGKAKEAPAKDNWALPAQQMEALGVEMAQAAVQQVQAGVTYWDRVRTLFVDAQAHKRPNEAIVALFSAGDKVKGKKAPWYRTYKSLLTSAADLKITVTNDMGMSALQKLIKEAKQERAENDPEQKEAKDAQMLEMFVRLAQGCLNRGISKATLAARLKELEA